MFVPRDRTDVAALVDAYPFAWITSCGPAGRGAAVLPLLAERDEEGGIQALFGHFARANPLVALLEQQPEAMILVQGPQGYVPPRLVANPVWGPTWNYAVARFEVDVCFVPDETEAAVIRLAAALEQKRADPWTVDRMGPRFGELSRHIIAFRATVRETHARFKLGQDEAPEAFDQIVSGLEDLELAAWMERTVRPARRS